uniref:Uncharacterized protein n=1 Tax=Brassica oleracea TaxID=3712 RepID=A0A3P6G3L2_BRAOL|nr:unnamed protein product [Brassica oleracea]
MGYRRKFRKRKRRTDASVSSISPRLHPSKFCRRRKTGYWRILFVMPMQSLKSSSQI